MKIDKIDVLTSNKKHATDISLLVDKREFPKEIARLREKWQITELKSIASPIPNTTMGLDIEGIICSKFNDPDESANKWQEFNEDIDYLLKKFNRGKNFKQVINYALVAGAIPEGVYRSCYFDVVAINEAEDMNKPERYQYVIVLSPRTEKKEVIEAYKEFKEHIKGKIDFQHSNLSMDIPLHEELIMQYHRGNIHDSADIDKIKTQKLLDRTREWYWMRYGKSFNDTSIKPTTYEQVYFDWLDKCLEENEHENKADEANCQYCSVQSWNDIEVALKNYRRLLSLS